MEINRLAGSVGPTRSTIASTFQPLLRGEPNPLQSRRTVECRNLGSVILRTPDKSDYDRVLLFQRELKKNRNIFWDNNKRVFAEWWVNWAIQVVREKTAVVSVGDVSGRIAGAATITQDYEAVDLRGEFRLAVTPWAEKNGLGRALTEDALEKAALVFPKVGLYVHRKNLTAQRIYKEKGFVECGGGTEALKMICEFKR